MFVNPRGLFKEHLVKSILKMKANELTFFQIAIFQCDDIHSYFCGEELFDSVNPSHFHLSISWLMDFLRQMSLLKNSVLLTSLRHPF